MNPSTLLNRPTQKITPHITKINSLVDSSEKIKKSSAKLRKVFEKGTYQKKTQLSILNRYKRRLNTIQNQNDKRFTQRRQVKIKPPEVKKFAGGFFSGASSSDPLKSLAALAALNAFQKGSKGNYGGALASALVASGLLFGPSLIRGGISAMRGGGSSPATPSQPAPTGGGLFRGTPYSQTGAGKAYAGMQSQRNLPKWAQRAAGGSASRFAASNERMFQGTANIGDRARVASRRFGFSGVGGVAENIAARGGGVTAGATTSRVGGSIAARAGGVGARLLGPVFNIGLSAYRFSQGDYVGGVLSALSAIPAFGWAAVGIDLAREFGVFDGTILGRKGKEKLKKQTEQQKKLVDSKRESGGLLSFGKTLIRYEKVVNKFEQFAKNFKIGIGVSDPEEMQSRASEVENLVGDQDIIDEPGYEFTEYTGQYLTGDPNSPAYDASHGGENYHDHIAFKDRDLAIRAYQYLESKGLDVTEFQGFDPVGRHSDGSAHYSGLAFDVPGYQWGASGPIDGRHYNGSRIVRKHLNDFFKLEKEKNKNLKSKKGTDSPPPKPNPQPSPVLNAISNDIVEESIIEPPAPKQRSISKSMHYSPVASGSPQNLAIPFPIIETSNQQMPVSEGSGTMISSGSKDMLNSFYKRVLLNQLV